MFAGRGTLRLWPFITAQPDLRLLNTHIWTDGPQASRGSGWGPDSGVPPPEAQVSGARRALGGASARLERRVGNSRRVENRLCSFHTHTHTLEQSGGETGTGGGRG